MSTRPLGDDHDVPTARYSRATTRPVLPRLGEDTLVVSEEHELATLRAELAEAKEVLGAGWFAGGARLPDALRRKIAVLRRATSQRARR
jgi:hypothetical protein